MAIEIFVSIIINNRAYFVVGNLNFIKVSSVQLLSRVWLFSTPWFAARQASLSITISRSSLRPSCPSSPWCHPAISSSVVPFSCCPQSLPVSESFPMSQLFSWGGQSTGASALSSFLPKKSQGWSPSEWTGWTPQFKSINSLALSLLYGPTLTSVCDCWKNHSFD